MSFLNNLNHKKNNIFFKADNILLINEGFIAN